MLRITFVFSPLGVGLCDVEEPGIELPGSDLLSNVQADDTATADLRQSAEIRPQEERILNVAHAIRKLGLL